nr:hypothetical protein CCACVL1_30839 [Ipomoea batatas]
MGKGPWKKLLPRSRRSRFCSLENTDSGIWPVPQVLKIANFKRNHILEKVSETTKVPELCQLPNLYWYCPREVVIAQVQKSELKEAADSRWDHSAQTIVIEIDASRLSFETDPPQLQMIPSQLHTFVRLLPDQEESSKEDDRPLIFHCKRASASLFACKGVVFSASKQMMPKRRVKMEILIMV